MPFRLPLPKRLRRQWTVKIRDRERVEPPHVTILKREKAWRLGLRTAEFLDSEPDPTEVPKELAKKRPTPSDRCGTRCTRRIPSHRRSTAMSEPVVLVGAPESLAAKWVVRPQRPHSREAVVRAYERNAGGALWVALRSGPLESLAHVAAPKRRRQDLLLLRPAGVGDRELLGALFRHVIAADEDVRLLPLDELVEVLAAKARDDRFIGGAVVPSYKSIVLYRGNLERLVVPAAFFKARPGGPKPNLEDLEVIDFGQTVRLGEYEAASNAILYELDADYRRRARQRHLGEDRSFGGALRRLRLQRGLSRADFPGLSAKEIARIERGEVEKPHAATLAVLARRLGIPAAEIGTY